MKTTLENSEVIYISTKTVYELAKQGLINPENARKKILEAESICKDEIKDLQDQITKMEKVLEAIQKMK